MLLRKIVGGLGGWKKNPIYFLCIENSCWKRSKGTDKEMRESTSSRLHLAPYERKKITLKLLPWWKKKTLWWMYSSRGGINSMNDSKAGGEGRVKREHLLERTFFCCCCCSCCWRIRVLFDSTAVPLSGDVTDLKLIAKLFPMCA